MQDKEEEDNNNNNDNKEEGEEDNDIGKKIDKPQKSPHQQQLAVIFFKRLPGYILLWRFLKKVKCVFIFILARR